MARPKKSTERSRRPAKRKSSDQADETEVRTATPNERPIDGTRFMQHVNTIKGFNGKISTLTGARRKHCQVIKAEGFSLDAINDTIRLERADPLEYRDYMRQLGHGIKAVGMPFQINIFDVAYGDPVTQAKAEAKAAASAGRSAECRWPEGSPEHAAYLDTYAEIQGEMARGLAVKEKETEDA